MSYLYQILIFGGIFGILAIFFCLIWKFEIKKTLYISLFSAYIGAVISLTFFHGILQERTYNLIPLITAITSKAKFYHIPQMMLNIALFVPLGVFLRIRTANLKRSILTGLLLSFGIEIFQLILMRGICDVDDLILNTLGTMVGFLLSGKIVERINQK